jgi:Raf kinase inhibitor-like YbhB/YbcL family protein
VGRLAAKYATQTNGETGVRAMLGLAGVIVLAFSLALGVVDAAGAAEPHFTLSSSAFNDNDMLPLKYAGGRLCANGGRGGDISPPLSWTSPPAGTKSFAVLMIDPDGRRGIGSVHWVAYGIPATRNGLREGEGATQTADVTLGRNSRGTMGYTGPCGPPVDAAHHYVIDVIALDLEPTTLQAGLDRDQLLNLITGHSLGPASIVVRYRSEQ